MSQDTAARGPIEDAHSRAGGRSPSEGGQPEENDEGRVNTASATSEERPVADQATADTAGMNRGHRRSTGSGPVSGSGAGAGGKGNPEDYDSDPQGGGGKADVRTDHGPKEGADAPVGGSR